MAIDRPNSFAKSTMRTGAAEASERMGPLLPAFPDNDSLETLDADITPLRLKTFTKHYGNET
ncbi:hypothetical protein GCM10027402_06930 [Arthrobacter monumenti]